MVSNVSSGSGASQCGRAGLANLLRVFSFAMACIDWSKLQIGDRLDIVCESVLLSCDGRHIMKQSGTGEFFVLHGEIHDLVDHWTIFNAKVVEGRHRYGLAIDDETVIHVHSPMQLEHVQQCVELGAGGGFMSVGFKAAGFQILAGIDKNTRFAPTYHENDLGAFIPGNIGDPVVVQKILQLGGQNATILSGIACQPYSTAGDQKGGKDERSSSLPFTLDCAWKIQSPLVVIECTPKAMTDEFVQSTLKTFCHQCGYQMAQTILHLDRCWSASRTRWWCVLSAASLGAVTFADMPMMPEFRTVKQVMPYIRQWPTEDIDDLALSLYEHSKFQAYANGVVANVLNVDQAMPTALHAWGNQCYPCACGCRPGFSEQRLQHKGLFGMLIPGSENIQHENQTFPKCRHIHPSEVALLSGAYPNIDWKHQCRLGLAVTGQMASPLQSCWVGAHVMDTLMQFVNGEGCKPEEVLRKLQSSILLIRDEMWPQIASPTLIPTRSLPLGTVEEKVWISKIPFGCPIPIGFLDGAKIRQLLDAESAFDPGAEAVHAFDEVGNPINPDECIQDGATYLLGTSDEMKRIQADPRNDVDMIPNGCSVVDLPLDFQGEQFNHTGNHDPMTPKALCGLPKLEVPELPMVLDPPTEDMVSGNSGFPSDALCQVSHDGLLAMLCPCIASDFSVAGLQSQQIPKDARLLILGTQELLWADDELRFHLQAFISKAPADQNVHVWDPLLISSAFRHHHLPSLPVELNHSLPLVTIITVVLIESHWIPVLWRRDQFHLLGYVANASHLQLQALQEFHNKVCMMWGSPITKLNHQSCPLVQSQCCGVVALEFLKRLVFGGAPIRTRDSLRLCISL